MRLFAVLLSSLLIMLPVLADGRDSAAGARAEVLLSAFDIDVGAVSGETDTEAETDSGSGIVNPLSILSTLPQYFHSVYTWFKPLSGARDANTIRGPPVTF